VGAFCAIMGTMMLVAPHQYRLPEYASFRLFLPWAGCLFVGSGVALLFVHPGRRALPGICGQPLAVAIDRMRVEEAQRFLARVC